MKNLPDFTEQTRILPSFSPLKLHEFKPSRPASIILLLHGYDERGLRILRKLMKYLPEDAHVLAPDAPYPLPRPKSDRVDYGYAWYFYNRFTQSFHTNQTLALGLLKNLLSEINPERLPVTIIGFSQGGYLAPVLAYEESLAELVIGIGCEFRSHYFPRTPHYKLVGIHGAQDKIVSPEHSAQERAKLEATGIKSDWHLLPEMGHEITPAAGEKIKEIMESHAKRSL